MRLKLSWVWLIFCGVFLLGTSAADTAMKKSNTDFILTRPVGVSKGTILLIHGSAPFNLDGRIPIEGDSIYSKISFYKDLAWSLNTLGWSVVRYSKLGVSQNSVDFEEYKKTDLKLLMQQLKDVWSKLPKNQPKIIFAWSEGTLHASQLPLEQAKAVVLLGAISTNIQDVILAQAKTSEEINEVKIFLKLLSSMPRNKMLGIDRPAGRLVDEIQMRDNWQYFLSFPKIPLLILHGGSDSEVSPKQAAIWKDKLAKHHIEIKIRPTGNHMYGIGQSHDSVFLATTIDNWLSKIIDR